MISSNPRFIKMSYYCDVCDTKIELKSRSKHFKSPTHKQYEKSRHISHTNKNPKFSDIDRLFNDYITNHI